MNIKYGSSTHNTLLILKSMKSKPKNMAELTFISGKRPSDVNKALDRLTNNGFVIHKDEKYIITAEGCEALSVLSGQSRGVVKEDDFSLGHYEAWGGTTLSRERVNS